MRISAKGRYGLAAMAYLAHSYNNGAPVTIIRISEKLGISKIYLEQVFSLLKRAGLVHSLKGSQGGYQLSRRPGEISAYDILSAIELGLLEVPDKAAFCGEERNLTFLETYQESRSLVWLNRTDARDYSAHDQENQSQWDKNHPNDSLFNQRSGIADDTA